MGISSTGFQRPRSGKFTGSGSTTSTASFTSLLNITGSGRLVTLATKIPTGTNNYYLKVTVDGVEIQTGGNATSGSTVFMFHIPLDNATTTTATNYDLSFKSSLKIEMKASESTYGCQGYWTYELE